MSNTPGPAQTEQMEQTEPVAPATTNSAWLPYVLPMVLFLLLTFGEGKAPLALYPYLYLSKAVVVTVVLVLCARSWRQELRANNTAGNLLLAVGIGFAVFAEWVVVDKFVPYPHLGDRVAYDPFTEIDSPVLRWVFLVVRFYGLALMVPVMEEVFWRSFLLRYITGFMAYQPFTRYTVGDYSLLAFVITAALFGLAHPEWLVAVICACAYAWLLRQTRSLLACVVAHAVTNAALGVYVVVTQEWRYW